MKQKIGIIGDGQLAKMLIESWDDSSLSFYVYGTDPFGPCQGLAFHRKGSLDNAKSLKAFADEMDLITFENEFFDSELLFSVGVVSLPSLNALREIENKISEKNFAANAGLKLGKYSVLESIENFSFTDACVIKLSKGAYDGYGTFIIRSESELNSVKEKLLLESSDLILEDMVDYEMEISITGARSLNGEIFSYPCVRSIQENAKCVRVESPAECNELVQLKAKEYLKMFLEKLEYVGVLSIEFFLTKAGELLFNECAPRPHNSAHFSMNQYNVSQFELHLRAILGLSFKGIERIHSFCVMENIISQGSGVPALQTNKLSSRGYLHDYNKKECRPGRKMGHFNVCGENLSLLRLEADKLSKEIIV